MTKLSIFADWSPSAGDVHLIEKHWPPEVAVGFAFSEAEAVPREAQLAEAAVLVGRVRSVTPDLLSRAPNLRLIHLMGHGTDVFDNGELASGLAARSIRVATSSSAGPAIAEYVIMSMIALNRRALSMHLDLALRGTWAQYREACELGESTACIVGLGSVGRSIADATTAFGMRVIGVTRNPDISRGLTGRLSAVYALSRLDEVISHSDYVVIALPLTAETRGLFDTGMIARMMRGSFLINVARGQIVDLDSLYSALASGHLGGAAIDAWPGDTGSMAYPCERPIHQFNVLMSPHCSGVTWQSHRRAIVAVGDNLRRFIDGRPLVNESSLRLLTAARDGRSDRGS